MPSSACCLAIAIFTLSLHDALPIWIIPLVFRCGGVAAGTVKDGSVCGDAESPGYRDVGFDAAEVHDVVGARPADRMDVLQLAEYPDEPRAMPVERELPPATNARPEVIGAGPETGTRSIDRPEEHPVDEA